MKKPEKRRAPPVSHAELDVITLQSIEELANVVYKRIKAGDKPTLDFPVRSLGNVSYDSDVGYLQIGDAMSQRTLTVNTAKSFAQTLLLMEFARSQIRKNNRSTKRGRTTSRRTGKRPSSTSSPSPTPSSTTSRRCSRPAASRASSSASSPRNTAARSPAS